MIPREFRQMLAELELLSHGSTQSWNKTAPPADKNPRPAGDSFPPHESFAIDYACARTADEKVDVIDQARRFLREWKGQKRPKPAAVRTQADVDKEMRGFTGWTPREIARRTGNIITEGAVMKWRREQKPEIDVSTGYEVREVDPTHQAVAMKAKGMNVREIARYQGVQPSTVSRRLKKAA